VLIAARCVGLAVDWRHGRLVFTNEDSATLNGVTYSWQRIETVRLDGSARRAIVTTDLHRPRGLAVDSVQQSVSSLVNQSIVFGLVRCLCVWLTAFVLVLVCHVAFQTVRTLSTACRRIWI